MQRLRATFISLILTIVFYGSAYPFCFEEAGAMYNISPQLLWSIARVESNFNHRALNWNKNGTYDFGVMQINSAWYKVIGHDLWMSLGDPCTNVKVGAWILSQCISRYGYTWQAVGCYNARNNEKRAKYAWKVYNSLPIQMFNR
jgi:soluble lytic murein transglycosylase-like protein